MKFRTLLASAGLAAAILQAAAPAQAQTERYLGEIFLFGGNFCPRGSAPTDGQVLPISNNSALFSILGTMYGGDGRTTFALPDLRGRTPVHVGQGPGLDLVAPGEKLSTTLPAPSASPPPVPAPPRLERPDPAESLRPAPTLPDRAAPSAPDEGSEDIIVDAGLGLRYCIATMGIYPSRS